MSETTTPRIIPSGFGARSTALEVVSGIALHGRNAIVTGGAAGLGLETSRALASAGAQVTLAVRNLEQGRAAARSIMDEFPQAAVDVALLDLGDLAQVQACAAAWNARSQALDILINNAAIMACPLTRTTQGWEAQFATNHLGHFALTTSLLPSLLRAAGQTGDTRVVALSSAGHKRSDVVFDDIHFERRAYDKWNAYGQAKSANALFALGLHLRYGGQGVTANAVHPGGIITGLQKFLPMEEMRAMGWFKEDGTPIDRFKNPQQGASTSIWAATALELKGRGGLYLEDCHQAGAVDPSNRLTGYFPYIADPASAERLWTASEALLQTA